MEGAKELYVTGISQGERMCERGGAEGARKEVCAGAYLCRRWRCGMPLTAQLSRWRVFQPLPPLAARVAALLVIRGSNCTSVNVVPANLYWL
eukprot:793342-Rhodomonas_salina.2